jgi:DNA-binding MarR family transcriptional regulator
MYFAIMIATLLDGLESRLALGLRADAARVGLHEATARLLLAIGPDEAVPMTLLAQRIVRDATTATRFADRASGQGLLVREAGTQDRRRRLARLTDEGRAARARLAAVRERRAEVLVESIRAETGLGEGQLEWFLQALGKAAGARIS